MERYELRPIGRVESPLTDRAAAPKQGHEGSPEAFLVLDGSVAVAARDLAVGQDAIVLTWLDRADRDVQLTRPREPAHRRLLHPLAGPAQPHRAAPGADPVDRRHPDRGARARRG